MHNEIWKNPSELLSSLFIMLEVKKSYYLREISHLTKMVSLKLWTSDVIWMLLEW